MQVAIDYGRSRAELDVADEALIAGQSRSPLVSLDDPAAAIRAALDNPFEFPPLRRALTPDDQVVVAVDERLPQLPCLLIPILEYLLETGVKAEAVTLLCSSPSTGQPWLDELPEELEEVRCEVHDPRNRRQLCLVTTIRGGRPLYFSRTAVDASQLIVLTGRRYDPLLGQGGGAGTLFPILADHEAQIAASRQLTLDAPGTKPWVAQRQATEAVWLLGAPFFVQFIEGPGDSIAEVITGATPSLAEGDKRHDQFWRRTIPRRV